MTSHADLIDALTGPVTRSKVAVREAYATQFFQDNDAKLARIYRTHLFAAGVPRTPEHVQDLRVVVFERVARRGPKVDSLVARYDAALNPAARELGPVAGWHAFLWGAARREAGYAARNLARRRAIRFYREEQDNGHE